MVGDFHIEFIMMIIRLRWFDLDVDVVPPLGVVAHRPKEELGHQITTGMRLASINKSLSY